jgi:hypothetical protein
MTGIDCEITEAGIPVNANFYNIIASKSILNTCIIWIVELTAKRKRESTGVHERLTDRD